MRKLSDWLDSFMKYCENSEPPDIYKKWVGISTIAAVLKRKCVLYWGHLTFYPNLYIVLVGPAGRTRKGTAMDPGYHLLRDIGIQMAAEATTREALIQELRRSEDTTISENGSPVIHSSLTIFSKELTVFLGYKNMQLIMDLTDWFDCRDRWTYRTKNAGTDEIMGVWVNLIGATTPATLQSSLPQDAIGGGLTSRIIFVYAEQKGKIVANPFLTDRQVQLYNDLLNDLQDIHKLAGEFYPTKGFIKLWEEWYRAQEGVDIFPGIPELDPYIERRPTHVLKLSMVMSASRNSSMELTEQDLIRAIKTLEEVEKQMPLVYSGVGQAPLSEVSAEIIAQVHARGEINARDLYRMFYRNVGDKQVFFDLLSSMSYVGAIEVVETPDGTIIKAKRR